MVNMYSQSMILSDKYKTTPEEAQTWLSSMRKWLVNTKN